MKNVMCQKILADKDNAVSSEVVTIIFSIFKKSILLECIKQVKYLH